MTETEAPAASPVVLASASTQVFGQLKAFDPDKENISTYLERVELYLDVNGVQEDKRVPVLLTVIGPSAYATVRSLVAPDKPRTKTYEQLEAVLKAHYEPKPLVIAERSKFYRRTQNATETVLEYAAELRRLAIDIIHLDRDWKRPHNADPCWLRIHFRIPSENFRVLHVAKQFSPDIKWSNRKTIISVSFTRVFCKSVFVCPHIILPTHIYSPIANCQAKTSNVKWPRLGVVQ